MAPLPVSSGVLYKNSAASAAAMIFFMCVHLFVILL